MAVLQCRLLASKGVWVDHSIHVGVACILLDHIIHVGASCILLRSYVSSVLSRRICI